MVVVHFANDHSSSSTTSPTASPSNGTRNSKVLHYIDTSYDPCKDFYKYSCGRWHSTRPDAEEWGTFDELEIDNYNKLSGYLAQNVSTDDPTAIKKQSTFIQHAQTRISYIRNNLSSYMFYFMYDARGWFNGDFYPYALLWNINNFYKDHYLGSSAFFSFGIYPDDLDSTKQVIRVTSVHAYTLVQA